MSRTPEAFATFVCFQSSALWAVSNSHAKSGLSQTFGTYCWADLADLSVT